MEEGGDEIDPLDAFMAENDGVAAAAMGAAQQPAAAPDDEDDDVDPLDAFMAAEVLPAVKQESGTVPAAAPASKKEQHSAAVPKAEAPAALPVGVKPELANGVAASAADNGAGLSAVPADKPPLVKRRARRRYADSDESSDDEPESASEDDEVCSWFAPFTRVSLTWRPTARAFCSTGANMQMTFACMPACTLPEVPHST